MGVTTIKVEEIEKMIVGDRSGKSGVWKLFDSWFAPQLKELTN